ncbi:SDR family oxidoreductase [Nocardia sp. R7R-8]|uniref:SDR family oxidoreductase n=1 Tax=Nocardia sp. R7R-8 TaxID=3459304 RepID=UPI00403DBD7D
MSSGASKSPSATKAAYGACMGRLCLPEDVADVVAYLASPQAGYVDCAIVDVDGGVEPTNAW